MVFDGNIALHEGYYPRPRQPILKSLQHIDQMTDEYLSCDMCRESYKVVVSNIFYFHPYLGKWSILTNIFQMGWNHQLG